MYIQVRLLSGLPKPLWYKAPGHILHTDLTLGTLVLVPIRAATAPAYVLYATNKKPGNFALKEIIEIQKLPEDSHFRRFLEQMSQTYIIEPFIFLQRLYHYLHQKPEELTPNLTPHIDQRQQMTLLTKEQHYAFDTIARLIDHNTYAAALIHGVTGSGKTEVYKQLMLHALAQNKSVLFLLPETSLAQAFQTRLAQELPSDTPLYGFHSGKTAKEKNIVWRHLMTKKPIIIVGVHQPVFLPIANLGLIIVDEEHDSGYQEKKYPKINSKYAALIRAQLSGCVIVCGSATPSLQTLYRVKTERWHFFQLKQRFAGAFPTITTVLLPEKKARRSCFWMSKELQSAIADRLAKKEQIIIFLNRRGYSFFIQCAQCTFIVACHRCSVSLTLHQNNQLSCHYCGLQKKAPTCCPSCKAPEEKLLKKGIGTQQAVILLQNIFPKARIERADMDITRSKKKWNTIVEQFTTGKIDILVGTQTITKGYHFPNVTLVGIIWADINIHFPLFDASERTLQQLIQVAGRAGRAHANSQVIVQSMAQHDIFSYLNEVDYLRFYATEMESRKKLCYPPYFQLIEIEMKYQHEEVLENESYQFTTALTALCNINTQMAMRILGPAKPLLHKVANMHQRTIFIKSPDLARAITLFKLVDQTIYKSTINFTPIF